MENNLPSRRKDARETGSRYYLTGRPCAQGHYAKRYTNDGKCTECKSAYDRSRYQDNKDLYLSRARKWVMDNYYRSLEYSKEWHRRKRALDPRSRFYK